MAMNSAKQSTAGDKSTEGKVATTDAGPSELELPKLDPEEFDPETIKVLGAYEAVMRKQQAAIETLTASHASAAQSNEHAMVREAVSWFDERINSLGEDFTESLGTGEYDSLKPGSPQVIRRDAVAAQVNNLLAGYNATGQETPSRNKVFDAAARLVLADEFQAVDRKKVSSSLKKRSGQHIQRVGGSKSKQTQSPEDAVAALLDKKYST